MKRRLALFAAGVLVFGLARFWPYDPADVSPLYQHHPDRPQHPSSIYTPKGYHR